MGEVIEFKPKQYEKKPETIVRDLYEKLNVFLGEGIQKEIFFPGLGLIKIKKSFDKNNKKNIEIIFEDKSRVTFLKECIAKENGILINLNDEEERKKIERITNLVLKLSKVSS